MKAWIIVPGISFIAPTGDDGVENVDSETLRLSNMIRDVIKPDVTMFMREIEQGKDIIKITIQKGTECPYYLQNKGLRPEGVFVRQRASSVLATDVPYVV